VRGLSRSPKQLSGVAWFGPDHLSEFADSLDVVVCALPFTQGTRAILDRAFFQRMRRGATVINVGRGRHLEEAALVEALDGGQLSWARLDVFTREPPLPSSPFWRHPNIEVTPHIATSIVPAEVAPAIVDNIHRVRRGQAALGTVPFPNLL
jgi:glyoxylate/hydroxypyruvate reductase A